jgi:hypothetical protein
MTIFTEEQYKQLILQGGTPDKDHMPVAWIHILFNRCQWLISELNPEERHIAFGLCDLGQGFPELGYVDLNELLAAVDIPAMICNDTGFKSKYPMSVYAAAAREMSEITINDDVLRRHVKPPKPE